MAQAQLATWTKGDEAEMVEVGETKGGWTTITDSNGIEHKVRNTEIELLEDDLEVDDDGEERERGGDVFPEGIRESYTKGKTESGRAFIDCGDALAQGFRNSTIEQVAAMLADLDAKLADAGEVESPKSAQDWINVYTSDREAAGVAPLNPGMVRMNLGNRIRGALKKLADLEAQAA